MKIVKGISLFFLYPVMMLVIGFYAGVEMADFFYPGEEKPDSYQERGYAEVPGGASGNLENGAGYPGNDGRGQEWTQPEGTDSFGQALGDAAHSGQAGLSKETIPESEQDKLREQETVLEAASSPERLYVDTVYVLEETDVDDHTVVETSGKLPEKYIGMNREQFLAAMENYAAAPPLTEMERGFVGLEVLSFSRERVVVQMNYSYVKPSTSFYLAVYDNEVLVYLDDLETVYIETDIRLDSLPEEIQQEIIQMKWIEDEETLFNFLESYSS